MSSDVSQIDYEAVRGVAEGFNQSGETLQGIDRAIEGFLTMLKSQAFVGMVSTAMLNSYINDVRTQLNEVIKTLLEMSNDLKAGVGIREDVDTGNSAKFR
ncbi:MAG: hypothetical protein SH821_09870 [Phototrophicales bacterium]|nr:hypothetical protein [Phototrophicales bacterium]